MKSTRRLSAVLLTSCAAWLTTGPAGASGEAAGILAHYGPLEWIGGINLEEASNGNGWTPSYEGRPAREVNLSEPHSAMGDVSGQVLVADKNGHAIRLIDHQGNIRTIAGTNTAGSNGAATDVPGPALTKELNGPQHAYPMPDGSFYILDTGNQRIRRVDAAGQMTTVLIETNWLSRGLWVKRDGSVIYYCTTTALKRWTPAHGTNPGTVMAQGFSELGNIDVAANGDIFLTDRGASAADPTFSRVLRITPDATPASYTPVPVAGTGGSTDSGSGATGTPALLTGLSGVRGVAFHPSGGYFLATHRGGDLWYVDTEGLITMVLQGNSGSANSPGLLPAVLPATGNNLVSELRSVSVALNGDLLIATNDAGYILRARYQGPRPAAPAVSVRHPAVPGGAVQLEWAQESGSWYQIKSTADPGASWQVRIAAAATGSPSSWTDPTTTTGQPRQSYQLTILRNWPN